jgi:DNA-binding PadR family transcriptional regulator
MTQTDPSFDPMPALPLSETTFLILISLEGEPKHGYAIMKDVEAFSHGRVALSTGTLYGAIKRLLGGEWIRRTELPDEGIDGRRRKYYTLTDRGRRILKAETSRLRELVAIAGRQFASGAQQSGD